VSAAALEELKGAAEQKRGGQDQYADERHEISRKRAAP
jgi:hypothetical protein